MRKLFAEAELLAVACRHSDEDEPRGAARCAVRTSKRLRALFELCYAAVAAEGDERSLMVAAARCAEEMTIADGVSLLPH